MAEPSHLRKWLFSSPPVEWATKQLRELVIGAMRQGPIPQHVAFEMDGNRRYARRHRMETVEGHHHGFEALARILEMCYKCGVKTVTVYAFSIENYNRPKYEVEGLMEMAKVKLQQLTRHGDILQRFGARVRVLGQRSLIREDVLEYVDQAIEMTKDNNKVVLNICFPYTSREEMTTAVRSTVEEYLVPPVPKTTPFSQTRITRNILTKQLDMDRGDHLPTIRDSSPTRSSKSGTNGEVNGHADADADDGDSSSPTLHPGADSPPQTTNGDPSLRDSLPNPETITAETLDKHMYTAEDPPLDILIRTSGVERLSDFMLWQGHQDSHIFFLKCFWPEFDLKHFVPVLLEWQWRKKQQAKEVSPRKNEKTAKFQRVVA